MNTRVEMNTFYCCKGSTDLANSLVSELLGNKFKTFSCQRCTRAGYETRSKPWEPRKLIFLLCYFLFAINS